LKLFFKEYKLVWGFYSWYIILASVYTSFFYTNNNGLNITSNWVTVFSNIYPIPIEEVLKILNNINIIKCLGVGSLFYKKNSKKFL
jgi:hypothetical protein